MGRTSERLVGVNPFEHEPTVEIRIATDPV